jgi:Sulfotransferase family
MRGRLELLGAAHPEARMIHIVRDGRAVAASLREKFMRSGESRAEGVGLAAAHWVDTIEEVGRLEVSTLTLRYEDLCADVHAELSRALVHAGLDPAALPFDSVPQTLAATNERRVSELAASELWDIQGAQARVLSDLGYLSA